MEMRFTHKCRLYDSQPNQHLHHQLDVGGIIWNHITALQKRYYRIFGKHISESRMKNHLAYLRMKTQRYGYWRVLGSQAVQDVCERHERAYQKFFNKQGGLPRFKKVKKYKSITLKQAGWKSLPDKRAPKEKQSGNGYHRGIGVVEIDGRRYMFIKPRPITGQIKTVTIKRDAAGRMWICFSVIENIPIKEDETSTGKIGGFDFGLKVFLTTDDGEAIANPLYFQQDLPQLRKIQSRVDKKVPGSRNRQRGKAHIARRHARIADKRREFHFQLAHDLCDEYDILVFETLNIAAMKRIWGRKVSDLGFAKFIEIVQWVAHKRGKQIVFVDRWERTTQKCSTCGRMQTLTLKDRTFCCENEDCGLVLDRDHNAAINIRKAGRCLLLSQLEED
ncbi:MAG: transposase, partial [Anaerolineae bacterium]|nr:transposase [Anaerolineae bacterium]